MDSGIREVFLVESGLLNNTTQGIWIPLTTGIQNPTSDKESGILYLRPGIHCVESRIQDYLGFLPWIQLMGRKALFRQYPREINSGTLSRCPLNAGCLLTQCALNTGFTLCSREKAGHIRKVEVNSCLGGKYLTITIHRFYHFL